MTRYILSIILTISLHQWSKGQVNGSTDTTLRSEVFGTERSLRIYMPERYHQDTINQFAVVYILDAQLDEYWDMVTGNIGYLVYQYQILPCIAVGIVSENRSSEFNPNSSDLIEHIEKEVKPLIASNYRVNNLSILVGHSWGGAFIGNVLFSEKRHLFDAYVAISPSFGALNGVLLERADSLMSGGKHFLNMLYCSSGDLGIRETEARHVILQLDSILKRYKESGLVFKEEIIRDTDHWSGVAPALNNGLLMASREFFADQMILESMMESDPDLLGDKIAEFNQRSLERYGSYFEGSAGYYRFLADDYREQERFEQARVLYLRAMQKGDTRVVTCYHLALTCEALRDDAGSEKYFTEAARLLELQKDDISNNLYNSLQEELRKRKADEN